MNVYLKNVIVGLIALFLCFPQVFHFAFAKSSTPLGSRWQVPGEEISADRNITDLIASYSSIAGYDVYNWYGESTTIANIYQAASGLGHSYSISFYIGHGNVRTVWLIEKHYDMATDNGTWVADDWIYPYSGCLNVKFVFMWSCDLGETIGGTHFWSGAYGMPYAWLHTTDLSSDGYADPDGAGKAFLGFAGATYGLADPWEGDKLRDFLSKFYFASLCCGANYSINDALDYAAKLAWNLPSFSDSGMYRGYSQEYYDPNKGWYTISGQMKVYGDGSMHISNLRPSCALKTRTDGYFYVPSVATSILKVEMLFDNKGIVGDQRGNISSYSSITCYPDGKVDLKDSYFIDMNFGKNEGMEGWDYMSDIVPDRTCDLKDSYIVNINFGKVGTYITVSGVTVTFNTGEVLSPDSDGFVTIPQGATSFTVKRNGNPIGAMIIFWKETE